MLFGDLHICGGQSNMQFTVGCIGEQLGFDANAEIADANNYPHSEAYLSLVGRSTGLRSP